MNTTALHIAIPMLGFGRAGGYRVLSKVASEWVACGHRVTFLSHASSPDPYFPTDAEVIWLNVSGRAVPDKDGCSEAIRSGPWGVFSNLRLLKRGLERHAASADLVLANHSLTAWSVALARVSGEKAYYIQAYEPEYYAFSPRWQDRVLGRLSAGSYRLPLRQVTNAPVYHGYPSIRATQSVPPGVDLGVFHPEGARPRTERPLVLGCIGRSELQKGIGYALDAYNRLRADGHPVRLHVAYGNLPEGADRREGLSVTVPANDAELADFYRSLDVLVAPGIGQRGAPHYPVMEAMACGVPVVTTGYLPADEANAYLVPEADADAIARAVARILDDPAEATRKAALGLEAMGDFGWARVAAALFDAARGAPAQAPGGAAAQPLLP